MVTWDTSWTFLLLLPCVRVLQGRVQVMQYGQYGGLNLVCGRDELIYVQSELLGFSEKDGACDPKPLCSVPYTLAKWYCRGRSSCSGMQVERRPLHRRTCGSDFTNCLRVEYQCVKRKSCPMHCPLYTMIQCPYRLPAGSKLTDICSNADYMTRRGFMATPYFPQLYPPKQNCSCELEAEGGVQLLSAFFLLRSSAPCKDWLSIGLDDSQEVRRCGYVPQQGPYESSRIRLNFNSDKSSQDMGFWLPFHSKYNRFYIVNHGIHNNVNAKQAKHLILLSEFVAAKLSRGQPPQQYRRQQWRHRKAQPYQAPSRKSCQQARQSLPRKTKTL
jgi:hypothetical protein